MTEKDYELFREQFQSIVWWKGELTSKNNYIKKLSRFDKNGSHTKVIVEAQAERNQTKSILEDKLKGFSYDDWKEISKKISFFKTRIRNGGVAASFNAQQAFNNFDITEYIKIVFSEFYLNSLIGKTIEIKYKGLMHPICTRKGRVEIEKDWMYLYDEGKNGGNFNVAFKLTKTEIDNFISITVIE